MHDAPPSLARTSLAGLNSARVFLLGCGLLVLLILVLFFSCGVWYWKGDSATTVSANEFLRLTQARDVEHLYEVIDPQWRSTQSSKQVKRMMAELDLLLGRLLEWKRDRFQIRTTTAGQFAELNFSADFELGKGEITMTMHWDRDRWRVLSYYVSSPLVKQGLTCPHCHNIHENTIPKYCSKCGRPMQIFSRLPDE